MRRLLPLVPFLFITMAALTNVALESRVKSLRVAKHDSVYLPPSWLVRLASVDHPTLAADYFWMQALQYYGEFSNRRVYYRDLHRYLELMIDLDPDNRYIYFFGAVTVPYNSGGWNWQNLPQAESLIRRGVERYPDDWRLYLQLGFIRGIAGDDRESAALAYAKAAAISGSPAYLPQLVARLFSDAGRLDRAEDYTRTLLADPELDGPTRAAMAQRLIEIAVEKYAVLLEQLAARFEEVHGRLPATLEELVTSGMIEALPEDPLGGSFVLQRDGTVLSTSLRGGRLRAFEEEAEQ